MENQNKQILDFIKTWSNHGNEVTDKVHYWDTLLHILGVPQDQLNNGTFIEYEKPIKLKDEEHFHGSIDAYIPKTHVLIEQKSYGVDLFKEENRPNGNDKTPITPYQQARRYDDHLPASEKSHFLVLSNFSQIVIYDVRESLDTKPLIIDIKDLPKQLYLLQFLTGQITTPHLEKEKRISLQAGELVGKIYNLLHDQYADPNTEHAKKSINALCVRLVFCLYAEDADLFASKEQFHDYLVKFKPNQMGSALRTLFRVLDRKEEERTTDNNDPLFNSYFVQENPVLAKFPYVNGGLFRDENIEIPPFTAELKKTLLVDASEQFDWSEISPTIFGAVFESTLNPITRRQGGMHYTSIENIHKVIDPLFLIDLKNELNEIKKTKQPASLKRKARAFQDKLANLTFFDPACGSGNFLTETYIQLRKLENEAIKLIYPNPSLDVGQAKDIIKVSIQQFFGIEINDFAVSVAKTALWIAESQMLEETKDLFFANWDFLPLKTYTHIHEGNALKMDWNKVIENYGCHYIIGNPPFVGPQKLSKSQKEDRANIFKGVKRFGLLDFVACWYAKAVDYMQGTHIQTAFVSTNSIVQGSQVPVLWQYLFEKGVKINFAYRSFTWESEARSKAQVVCVIIGFSIFNLNKPKYIFEEGKKYEVKNIGPYLTDSSNIFITARSKPISNVPKIMKGIDPSDDGNYLFTREEMMSFLAKEPQAKSLFHQYYMSRDFLNKKPRYILWFKNVNPTQLRKMPLVLDRIKKVKDFRSNSGNRDATRFKDQPLRPTWYRYYSKDHADNALVIPLISTFRNYIPMDIINKNTICGGTLFLTEIHSAYMFGILESKVNTDWVKAISNHYGKGLVYSNSIIYNNFPFPTVTDEQKRKIERTAQGILDARKLYPDSSLADLYDPLTMPEELRKAHQANDKVVLEAYGLTTKATESEIVAHLFKMYEKMTKK